MTLYKDPITWNQNQQLLGEVIKVYMKDSVMDRAHVINQAFSIEDLGEKNMFNQVSSKEMFAFFTNGNIRETQAVDNVLVNYYPIDESDSTYIGMVAMETSLMRMFLKNRKLERIWTPKSEGVVYPLTQIPPSKRYLSGFAWFDYVRPLSKDDIFVWRGKRAGTELKPQKRREAPLQKLPTGGKLQLADEKAQPKEKEKPAEEKTEEAGKIEIEEKPTEETTSSTEENI